MPAISRIIAVGILVCLSAKIEASHFIGPPTGDSPQRSDPADSLTDSQIVSAARSPQLSITPSSLNFGQIRAGLVSSPQAVTLTNIGTTTLDVIAFDAAPSPYLLSPFVPDACPNPPPFSLTPGQSCDLGYSVAPIFGGFFVASIHVNSNSAMPPAPFTLQVEAVDVVIDVLPAFIDFGDVTVGTTAVADLLVFNLFSGTTTGFDLEVFGVANPLPPEFVISPGTCGSFPFTLPYLSSCELEVAFTPSSTGPFVATDTLMSDATAGSGDFDFIGSGVAPGVPELTLFPDSADFGLQRVGDISSPELVELFSTGSGAVSIASIESPTGPFFVFGGTCPVPPFLLASNCTIEYTFAPITDGTFAQTLDIVSDDPHSPHTVTLTGEAAHSEITVSPTMLDFGAVPVAQSVTLVMTVSNSSQFHFDVLGPSVVPLPPEFVIVPGTCPPFPFPVLPGQDCELEVTFTPAAVGLLTVSDELAHDATAGSAAFTLQGLGGTDPVFSDRFEQ